MSKLGIKYIFLTIFLAVALFIIWEKGVDILSIALVLLIIAEIARDITKMLKKRKEQNK